MATKYPLIEKLTLERQRGTLAFRNRTTEPVPADWRHDQVLGWMPPDLLEKLNAERVAWAAEQRRNELSVTTEIVKTMGGQLREHEALVRSALTDLARVGPDDSFAIYEGCRRLQGATQARDFVRVGLGGQQLRLNELKGA